MTDTDEAVERAARAIADNLSHYEFHTSVCGDRKVLKLTVEQAMQVLGRHLAALAAADGGEVERLRAVADAVTEWHESGEQVAHYNQCARVGDTPLAATARYRRMRDAEAELHRLAALHADKEQNND